MTRRLAYYCQEQINKEMSMSDEYRRCDQANCDSPATHYYVWMKPQYACAIHAQRALGIAAVMGFPTVAATMRTLTLDEMLPDDPRDADHGGV